MSRTRVGVIIDMYNYHRDVHNILTNEELCLTQSEAKRFLAKVRKIAKTEWEVYEYLIMDKDRYVMIEFERDKHIL